MSNTCHALSLWFCVAHLTLAIFSHASYSVNLEWVTVGDAGNVEDETGYGSVSYDYRIGKYEVTSSQYAEFLNAVAVDDVQELYHERMRIFGIQRSGEPGGYSYVVRDGFGNRPVPYATFWNALRFINWLHNGQPVGPQGPSTTEDGAYTLTQAAMASNTVVRNRDAHIFLPSEDEWYKAAFYKSGNLNAGYWMYPTQSDVEPQRARPTNNSNSANHDSVVGITTDVGSYPNSAGPYGTFDQAGNLWEWNESVFDVAGRRVVRGGSWFINGDCAPCSSARGAQFPDFPASVYGFRVVSEIPPACDFDDDFSCTSRDMDLLLGAFGSIDDRFNLDSRSPAIDEADRDEWLEIAGELHFGHPFQLGDVDLNGVVDVADLNTLGRNWLQTGDLGWPSADFNGDQVIDEQDLNLLGTNWQTDIRTFAAAVPEPSAAAFSSVLLVALLGMRNASDG